MLLGTPLQIWFLAKLTTLQMSSVCFASDGGVSAVGAVSGRGWCGTSEFAAAVYRFIPLNPYVNGSQGRPVTAVARGSRACSQDRRRQRPRHGRGCGMATMRERTAFDSRRLPQQRQYTQKTSVTAYSTLQNLAFSYKVKTHPRQLPIH